MAGGVRDTGTAIVGGGIAGLATALELLDAGQHVALVERAPRARLGGLANEAFGGMLFAGTREQRLNGIRDSAELLRADWYRAAEFGDDHDREQEWPRRWADTYVERSVPDVYEWVRGHGIRFFPVVHWVERGEFVPLNSLPRYHVVWGTGWHLTQTLVAALENHPQRARLTLHCGHYVEDLLTTDGRVTGVRGTADGVPFVIRADTTVVASGGINGNLERVRAAWDRDRYGEPPARLLNGAHPDGDGHLHDVVARLHGRVVRLGQMWNYPAGVRHPHPQFAGQGLSLIPPRSALWLDCFGRRVGPHPMVSGFDTHDLCRRMGHLPHQYAWLLLNRRILEREMAVSGSHVNPAFCQRDLVGVLREVLLGSRRLYRLLVDECPDVVVADTPGALAAHMNDVTGEGFVSADNLHAALDPYDAQVARGQSFHDDDQLRRIAQVRRWRGDRVRTLRFQAIGDPAAGPLVAIRVMLLSRKSMGGIETDLCSRVLGTDGAPVPGLYAAGECAGFGGGGQCGIRSLEGTFLSGCILSGRMAARAIAGG